MLLATRRAEYRAGVELRERRRDAGPPPVPAPLEQEFREERLLAHMKRWGFHTLDQDLVRWQTKNRGRLDAALSTSPIGPRMCPDLFAEMGIVLDGGRADGMFGGPGDKWYRNGSIGVDFADAIIRAGKAAQFQCPHAARSRTYVSPGTTLRFRNPAANALRNAPEWTDKWTAGLRKMVGWRDDAEGLDPACGVTYVRERPITGSTAEANYELLGHIHATPAEEWPANPRHAELHKYAEVIIGATPVGAIRGVLIEVAPAELWKYLEGGAGFWAPMAQSKLCLAKSFIRNLRKAFPRDFANAVVPIAVVTPARDARVVRRHQLGRGTEETRAVGATLRVVGYA